MARSFNGTSDKLSGSDVGLPTTTRSITVWFRTTTSVPSGPSDGRVLLYYGTASSTHAVIFYDNNNHLVASNYGAAITGTTDIHDGNWHLAMLIVTGNTWSIYLDGSASTEATGTLTTSTTLNGTVLVGSDGGGITTQNFWSGDIGEIGVWNATLSLLEWKALYQGRRAYTVRAASLVRYIPMFGVQSPEPDLSGQLHALTLTGTALATTGPPINYFTGTDGSAPLITTAAATAITMTGPSSGYAGAPSSNFTIAANGSITGTVIVTLSDGGASGTFTPTTISINTGSPSGTFTYTPTLTRNTSVTLSETNNGGLSDATPITYTVSLPTISTSPIVLPAGSSGQTVTVTGVGSLWLTNAPTITLTGVFGSSKTGQSVVNDTTITLTITTGSTTGTATITETVQGETTSLIVGVQILSKVVQFGSGYISLVGTVGYVVYNDDGTIYAAHTTSGITEIPAASGNYAAAVTVPVTFAGAIVWDTGGSTPVYASDEINLYQTILGSAGLSNILVAGQSLPNAIKYIGAAVSAKCTGAGSGTETYDDFSGATAFVVTIDTNGNRTGISYT